MSKTKALKILDSKQVERIEKTCAEAGEDAVKVGDIFHHGGYNDSTFIRVYKIEEKTTFDHKKWELAGEPKSRKKFEYKYDYISFGQNEDWECEKWSESYGSEDLSEFLREHKGKRVPDNDVRKLLDEGLDVISGKKDIEDYEDKSAEIGTTSLIQTTSSKSLQVLSDDLSLKARHVDLVKISVKFEIERRKAEIMKVKEKLDIIVSDMRNKVRKLERVIATIELYLGINEQVIQIQEGEKAPESTKISLRQEVLCMDEEVGDPTDGGLDFKNITDFDDWLRKYSEFHKTENYKIMIPEEKGVVVFRVRREDKDYVDNPILNSQINEPNRHTYILIRNGENLYRIWGEIVIFPFLFPHKSELQELKDKWDKIETEGLLSEKREDGGYTVPDSPDEAREKIDDKLFRYKRQILILQGLIDRTEVFHPLPDGRINLMDAESHIKSQVELIYDVELKLPDSRPPFSQWLKGLNKSLKEGSRILYIDSVGSGNGNGCSRLDDRFHSENKYDRPNSPKIGVYNLENRSALGTRPIRVTVKSEKDFRDKVPEHQKKEVRGDLDHKKRYAKRNPEYSAFPFSFDLVNAETGRKVTEEFTLVWQVILYNPEDTIYNWWDRWHEPHDRTIRISWKILLDSDELDEWNQRQTCDENIINYDEIKLEDIDFYLNSRVNRKMEARRKDSGYLRMMPILFNLKKMLKEEKAHENHFVRFVLERYKGLNEERVREAIVWWKLKNKWKRALSKDDAKAVRMITKEARR